MTEFHFQLINFIFSALNAYRLFFSLQEFSDQDDIMASPVPKEVKPPTPLMSPTTPVTSPVTSPFQSPLYSPSDAKMPRMYSANTEMLIELDNITVINKLF